MICLGAIKPNQYVIVKIYVQNIIIFSFRVKREILAPLGVFSFSKMRNLTPPQADLNKRASIGLIFRVSYSPLLLLFNLETACPNQRQSQEICDCFVIN